MARRDDRRPPVQRPPAVVRLAAVDRDSVRGDPREPTQALSSELETEREAVLREIDEAFAGVTRGRGISWNETMKIDGEWTRDPGVSKIADPGGRWDHFVEDPTWDPDTGFGGWSFLDAAGFRYYLPPAMVRCVRAGHDTGLMAHRLGGTGARDRRWSLLGDRQGRCILRFLWFMAFASLEVGDEYETREWTKAAEGYWARYGDTETRP